MSSKRETLEIMLEVSSLGLLGRGPPYVPVEGGRLGGRANGTRVHVSLIVRG